VSSAYSTFNFCCGALTKALSVTIIILWLKKSKMIYGDGSYLIYLTFFEVCLGLNEDLSDNSINK
jgi:hypothetical protein